MFQVFKWLMFFEQKQRSFEDKSLLFRNFVKI